MKRWFIYAIFMICLVISVSAAEEVKLESNRVLLIIDDQWNDPASYVIQDSEEFQEIAALLKLWCVPFDILRLDQEPMTINRFLDASGNPAYGCIIWDANQSELAAGINYAVLKEAVVDLGINLIAISNRIHEPEIEKILGLEYIGYSFSTDEIRVNKDHFVTRPFTDQSIPAERKHDRQKCVQVKLAGAEAIAMQGEYPQITVNKTSPEGPRVVWLGGDHEYMFRDYIEMRTILKRALVWCTGYAIYKTYPRTVMVKLDDPGTAQCAFLAHWNYPTLTREQMRLYLNEPLKEYNCVMNMHVCSGFVNSRTRRIEVPWTQKFVDDFGNKHDYASTKAGLLDGMKEGVLEIQCHGWTHMQPDLDSSPGPWWDAAIDGEKAETGWYREFYDTRRNKEIPSAVQAFTLGKGLEGLKEQFNVEPLSFRPGGAGFTTFYPNSILEIAARLGFGTQAGFHFLGPDRIIDFSPIVGETYSYFDQSDDIKAQFNQDDYPILAGMHDRDIALDSDFVRKCLESLGKETKYISNNEAVAYWHSQISNNKSDQIIFEYDQHYCKYFEDHSSVWTLHIADWLQNRLGKREIVSQQGKVLVKDLAEVNNLILEPGLFKRVINIH
ncbi:hypothetical protein JXQ31_13145 [candidate division KSB1 bacterium]|nr:hypothetical protein [candidate division KSB1 bacterium]